jgi:hypothetical protein
LQPAGGDQTPCARVGGLLVSRPGTLAEITIVDRFKQNLKVYKPWENRVLHGNLPSIKGREFGTDSAIDPKHFFWRYGARPPRDRDV